MKCIECNACRKGYFESRSNAYVCIGVKEPFVIDDINCECTEYPGKKTGYTKHKYLREIFPDSVPFPYDEEDYHGFDARDTFNMDYTLIMWLYERLRYFQDKVSETIKMTDKLYMFGTEVLIDDKETTLKECVDRMVKDCKIILLALDGIAENYAVAEVAKNDLFKVLSKAYWAMWW